METTTSIIKHKDNRISELEMELAEIITEPEKRGEEQDTWSKLRNRISELRAQIADLQGRGDGHPSLNTWNRIIREKDEKIEKLEDEVRKHTHNLQGIVNTELWEKNREIEKLQSRLTEKVKLKDNEIGKLEKELIGKDMQLNILKDKIEELGIHVNLPSSLIAAKYDEKIEIPEEVNVLKEQLKLSTEKSKYLQRTVVELSQQLRNTPERESDGREEQFKSRLIKLQQDYDKSEKCRAEIGNVCVLLTTRLEELAHFLDSLLKHKSVLGLLGMKQHSAIKHAIDQSLDLSKTFSMSMMEDKSLTQLSGLSGLLNSSQATVNMSLFDSYLEEEAKRLSQNMPLTYNTHLNKKGDIVTEQNEIIRVLREQIETMKKEIELRDMELSKQHVLSDIHEKSLKNDNDLVEVLMEMQGKTKIMSPNEIFQNLLESKSSKHIDQSESEAWSEPDRDVSQARIGLDAESLKSANISRRSKHSEGGSTESTEEETSNRTPSKRNSSADNKRSSLNKEINELENKLKEKENEILTLQCKLMDNDNKGKESQIKLYAELDALRKEKLEMEKLLHESEKMIETLENKRLELEQNLEDLVRGNDNVLRVKENDIKTLTDKLSELETIIECNDADMNNKLLQNDKKWADKIHELEDRIQELKEAKNQLEQKYEKEWVHKDEVTKHHIKLQMVYNELESLKEVLKTVEEKSKLLEQEELELNKKLQESERDNREKIITLKRELNEYALRTSQAVLERSKLNNEKLRLEQELRRIEIREKERSTEFDEKEKQFINMKNNIQRQLSQIELQKSHLQLKVTELETTNVELHNRILRLQSGEMNTISKSTPSSPVKVDNFPNVNIGKHSLGNRFAFSRQRSDMSGYMSETEDFNRSAPEAFHWFASGVTTEARTVENSSPDLGIESDPGRFSSLETNPSVCRPLLHTLQLTASMNNLLSTEQQNDNAGQCKYFSQTLKKFLRAQ